MQKTLKQQAISGTKWSSILQFGKYGISFFLSIILARLLEPEEFGLIGMLTIFTVIAKIFINSGLSTAIIRDKAAEEKDFSTVFYFNLLVSLLFYVALYLSAPAIARFYEEPILIKLTRWVSLVFVINAFGLVQNAILVRKIDFKTQSISHLTGLAVSAVVGGFMAFQGHGVWSIVGQILSQAIVTNILLWILSAWKPRDGFSIASFKKLWAFGSKILATTVVVRIIENIDNIIIGKIFNASQLGFYTRAKGTKDIPQNILGSILSSVTLSVLSNTDELDNHFKHVHLRFFKLSTYLFLPAIVFVISAAEPFIVFIYSDKWLPAVSFLQIIGFIAIPYLLGRVFNQSLIALGKGDIYMKINIGKKLLLLLPMPLAVFFNLTTYLIGLTSMYFIGLVLDVLYTGKMVQIPLKSYLIASIKPVINSIILGLGVYIINLFPLDHGVKLGIQVICATSLFFVGSKILHIDEYTYLSEIIKSKMKR